MPLPLPAVAPLPLPVPSMAAAAVAAQLPVVQVVSPRDAVWCRSVSPGRRLESAGRASSTAARPANSAASRGEVWDVDGWAVRSPALHAAATSAAVPVSTHPASAGAFPGTAAMEVMPSEATAAAQEWAARDAGLRGAPSSQRGCWDNDAGLEGTSSGERRAIRAEPMVVSRSAECVAATHVPVGPEPEVVAAVEIRAPSPWCRLPAPVRAAAQRPDLHHPTASGLRHVMGRFGAPAPPCPGELSDNCVLPRGSPAKMEDPADEAAMQSFVITSSPVVAERCNQLESAPGTSSSSLCDLGLKFGARSFREAADDCESVPLGSEQHVWDPAVRIAQAPVDTQCAGCGDRDDVDASTVCGMLPEEFGVRSHGASAPALIVAAPFAPTAAPLTLPTAAALAASPLESVGDSAETAHVRPLQPRVLGLPGNTPSPPIVTRAHSACQPEDPTLQAAQQSLSTFLPKVSPMVLPQEQRALNVWGFASDGAQDVPGHEDLTAEALAEIALALSALVTLRSCAVSGTRQLWCVRCSRQWPCSLAWLT